MEQQIGEQELKFVFDNCLARKLVFWLQNRCILDPEYPEGIISSIYYDTRDWSFLGEKINSDYLKTKIRLRWYSDRVTGTLLPKNFLEAKFKTGSARQKIRVETGIDSQWIAGTSLTDPAFLHVPELLLPYGILFAGTLYPALQINYTRLRFVDPITGSRLCVDSDIHVSRCNRTMVKTLRSHPLKQAVFEFKGKSGVLPDWLHQLMAFGCRRGSFSKFSACYQHVTNIQF
ncbi:MAG: VTC domain-containing protein [Desulfoprunum sp.]|nr:VTC domain-containing protein [Desulfoprunum sp.]